MPAWEETEREAQLEVFHDHIDYLFPIGIEREWFLDWLAFNVQAPDRRCPVTPLHVSVAQGTGRGWLVQVINKLLGPWNCTKTDMKMLTGNGNSTKFTNFLDRSLFCAVEEVRGDGKSRYAISDEIRDTLTEPTLEVNVKHGTIETKPVYTKFFFMTNNPDALALKEEDRRVNVFTGPWEPQEAKYYSRLYGWLDDEENLRQLFWWLKRRNLSTFPRRSQRSMDTPGRQLMIQSNQSDTEQLLSDLIDEPPAPVMTMEAILYTLRTSAGMGQLVDATQVQKIVARKLTRAIRSSSGNIKVKGRVRRPWQFDRDKVFTTEEIRELLEEEHEQLTTGPVGII